MRIRILNIIAILITGSESLKKHEFAINVSLPDVLISFYSNTFEINVMTMFNLVN